MTTREILDWTIWGLAFVGLCFVFSIAGCVLALMEGWEMIWTWMLCFILATPMVIILGMARDMD
jgi:hypothetical protein